MATKLAVLFLGASVLFKVAVDIAIPEAVYLSDIIRENIIMGEPR